jgi:hypothetical protein
MKKCPKCSNQPISFNEWCRGVNAFSYSCNACKIGLKATPTTYIGFLLTLVAAIAAYLVASEVYGFSIAKKGLSALVVLLPPAVIGAVVGYRFSGYRVSR